MTIPGTNIVKRKHIILMIYGTILLAMSHVPAFAQELPPKPLTIIATTLQNMNFGTFLIGSSGSGSVIIYPDGSRICSGNVFPVNSTTSALRYEVVALPGTLITIVGQHLMLSGSNGGTIGLDISDSDPHSPFIATGIPTGTGTLVRMQVTIGGKLTIVSSGDHPPGNYGASFDVTFIQQ
jgi:hypothetical protein